MLNYTVPMTPNLNALQDFFSNNSKKFNICINTFDEKVDQFYFYIINYFADKNNIKINYNPEANINFTNNLFDQKEVMLIKSSSKNKIQSILDKNIDTVLFMDYKNFKNYSKKYLSVNSYSYKDDIKCFITNILDIQSEELVYSLQHTPEYSYSEITKYLLNNKVEVLSNKSNQDTVQSVRKDYYNLAIVSDKDLISKYKIIKKELLIKKFSFLTY